MGIEVAGRVGVEVRGRDVDVPTEHSGRRVVAWVGEDLLGVRPTQAVLTELQIAHHG